MGNPPQDEVPHPLKGVRPLEDDQFDRREVEALQGVQLTRTKGRGLLAWYGDLGGLTQNGATSVLVKCLQYVRQFLGDLSGEDTPGPIPNPAVKLASADGTALVAGWESRSLPRNCLSFWGILAHLDGKARSVTLFHDILMDECSGIEGER